MYKGVRGKINVTRTEEKKRYRLIFVQTSNLELQNVKLVD